MTSSFTSIAVLTLGSELKQTIQVGIALRDTIEATTGGMHASVVCPEVQVSLLSDMS